MRVRPTSISVKVRLKLIEAGAGTTFSRLATSPRTSPVPACSITRRGAATKEAVPSPVGSTLLRIGRSPHQGAIAPCHPYHRPRIVAPQCYHCQPLDELTGGLRPLQQSHNHTTQGLHFSIRAHQGLYRVSASLLQARSSFFVALVPTDYSASLAEVLRPPGQRARFAMDEALHAARQTGTTETTVAVPH